MRFLARWYYGIVPFCTKVDCRVVWWCLWNFIVRQVNFNYFASKRTPSNDCLISCKTTWGKLVKNLTFSVFKVNLLGQKSTYFSQKQFLYNNIRRTYFIKIIFNSVHIQTNLFSKTVPNFWWLCLKLSYKILKNTLKGLIRMQKTFEIHLPH